MKTALKKTFLECGLFRKIFFLSIREIRGWMRDMEFLFLTAILPIALSLIFVLIYNTGMVRKIPVAVYNEDNSELSRMFEKAVESSSLMHVAIHAESVGEIADSMRSGAVQGGFYFPRGMERDLKRNHRVSPVLYKNSQNIIVGGFLLKESRSIFRTFNGGVILKKLRSTGMTEKQALSIVSPMFVDASILYNANFNYKNFLCPGLIFSQFQLLMMVGGVLLFTREIDKKRWKISLRMCADRVWLLFSCKLVMFLIIETCIAAVITGIIFPLSKIYITGNYINVLLVIAIYIAASTIFGMTLGVIFRNMYLASEIAIFLSIPGFIMSGYTFPLWAVPKPLAIVSEILPYKHFFTAYFKTAQMNLPLSFAASEISKMLLFVLPLPLITFACKKSGKRISICGERK